METKLIEAINASEYSVFNQSQLKHLLPFSKYKFTLSINRNNFIRTLDQKSYTHIMDYLCTMQAGVDINDQSMTNSLALREIFALYGIPIYVYSLHI